MWQLGSLWRIISSVLYLLIIISLSLLSSCDARSLLPLHSSPLRSYQVDSNVFFCSLFQPFRSYTSSFFCKEAQVLVKMMQLACDKWALDSWWSFQLFSNESHRDMPTWTDGRLAGYLVGRLSKGSHLCHINKLAGPPIIMTRIALTRRRESEWLSWPWIFFRKTFF